MKVYKSKCATSFPQSDKHSEKTILNGFGEQETWISRITEYPDVKYKQMNK